MDEEGLMADFTSEFIYKPPQVYNETNMPEPIKTLFKDSFTINLKDKKETTCLDCDAKSHIFNLEEINFNCPKMEALKDALLFVLWNTDWPVGD